MKRITIALFAALIVCGYAGLAYGFAGNFENPTITANQHAMGYYLNHTGTQFFVWLDPVHVTAERLLGTPAYLPALNQLSPEGYAAFTDINAGTIYQFQSLILGRLVSLHAPGNVAREGRRLTVADAGTMMLDTSPLLSLPATDMGKGWSVWGEGFGLFGYQANRSESFGYTYNTGGFSLGVDKAITDTVIVGLLTGYSHTDVRFNDVLFSGKVNAFDLGVYGSYSPGPWYIDASFNWARNWQNTERPDFFAMDTAEASFFGDAFATYAGGGYDFDIGKARITPTLSLTYTYYNQQGFTERNAGLFNMRIDAFDAHSLVSRVGVRFAYEFDLANVTIVPEARAEWAHEYLDTDRTIVSRIVALNSLAFEVSGVEPERNSAILGLGVTAYVGKNLSLYADYDAEVREHYNSHGFTIGINYEF